MLKEYKDILTVKELYDILPLGKNKIYELLNNGCIKNIKIGKKILIPKKYLIDFLEIA